MNNYIKILFLVFLLCGGVQSIMAETYYFKLTKKIDHGNSYTNTAGGQFITIKNNECYDSDKFGYSVGNGRLKYSASLSKSSPTYSGKSYFGQVIYRFNNDYSILNIHVNDDLIYVYKRTSPPEGVTTCSLIKKHSAPTYQYNNYYDPGVYVQDYSPGYEQNNYNSPSNNNNNNNYYYHKSHKKSCTACGTTGKCPTCYGTKIARSFGNEYRCNACNANGDCSVCKGKGYID